MSDWTAVSPRIAPWRLVSERSGFWLAALAVAALARGRFVAVAFNTHSWPELTLGGSIVTVLLWRWLVGWSTVALPDRRDVERVELGVLLLALVAIAIQRAGGLSSALEPVFYLCVLLLVGLNRRWVGFLLTLAALALVVAVHAGMTGGLLVWHDLTPALVYLTLFAFGNMLLLQGEVQRRRREHQRRLTQELRALREEARDFRLIGSSLASRPAEGRDRDEAKLARGGVEAIHQSMFFLLDLLKKSLDLQTCVLLWLDASGNELRIKEMVTDSRLVRETPIPAHAGALGGIVKNRLLLNLRSPRRGVRDLPYYSAAERVGAFAGVPVVEGGHLRGVLCVDRREDRPFSATEERVLLQAAEQVVRAIQTERVLTTVERSKYEYERFLRASTTLNAALTLEQVFDNAFAAAREVAMFDFAAVTLYDSQRRRHTISRVWEPPDERSSSSLSRHGTRDRLEGGEFGDNAGLVAMVVKNRHLLPAVGEVRDWKHAVFSKRMWLPASESLVVLPLLLKDQAIGTFVVAATHAGRFPQRTRDMLGVIGNQVAVAIENAKMYRRMEEMATTDGLTSLPNHRTFQTRFSEMLDRAERHEKPVSLIITDVDKFKSINDTYGHPIGDQVLKRVAAVLAQHVRKVDVVARYGGEEFAIVLEETDVSGARLLSERVRQAIAEQVMSSDKGTFSVTISLGVASYPLDGATKEVLVERADQSLYRAKHAGRNRTVCYAELRKTGAAPDASHPVIAPTHA